MTGAKIYKTQTQYKPGLQKARSPIQAGCPPGDIIASAIDKMDVTRRRKADAIKLKHRSD